MAVRETVYATTFLAPSVSVGMLGQQRCADPDDQYEDALVSAIECIRPQEEDDCTARAPSVLAGATAIACEAGTYSRPPLD